MTAGHLWYVRRGTQQRGPFPIAVIERNIGLGRIVASDTLSPDGEHWHPATEFPDFELHQRAPERGLSRRLDERQHERRGSAADGAAEPTVGRRQDDRRQSEEPVEVERRQRSYGVWQGLRTVPRIPRLLAPALAVTTLGLIVLGWWARPTVVEVLAQCEAPPVRSVVWAGCDKRDADLHGVTLDGASLRNANLQRARMEELSARGADLAYADLSAASLTGAHLEHTNLAGATLRNANLTGADFSRANLSFADLTGARLASTLFEGADLSNALWVDGSVCMAPSVGVCRLEAVPETR